MRCRLYIDEVGNNDLSGSQHNDNERYISLTGIIAKDSSYERQFRPRLFEMKEGIFGSGGGKIVLHRREIVRREGSFAVLRDPTKASLFNEQMLHLFRTLPYLATTVVLDKRAHLEAYGVWHFDPYHYCLRVLVERYVLWMRRNAYTGDVAVEPRNPKPDRRLKDSFRGIFERGTDNVPAKIVQKHLTSREIKFTAKSANCPAMQVCDLLAHPSYRAMKFERQKMQQPDDFGSAVVNILEQWKYARNPVTFIKDGWGKKWLPK